MGTARGGRTGTDGCCARGDGCRLVPPNAQSIEEREECVLFDESEGLVLADNADAHILSAHGQRAALQGKEDITGSESEIMLADQGQLCAPFVTKSRSAAGIP
jgi:hypothetical protein